MALKSLWSMKHEECCRFGRCGCRQETRDEKQERSNSRRGGGSEEALLLFIVSLVVVVVAGVLVCLYGMIDRLLFAQHVCYSEMWTSYKEQEVKRSLDW
jgi:hypothetical protein